MIPRRSTTAGHCTSWDGDESNAETDFTSFVILTLRGFNDRKCTCREHRGPQRTPPTGLRGNRG